MESVFGYIADLFTDCHRNLNNRGPSYNIHKDQRNADKSSKELVQWASEYWIRDSKSCFKYHKELYDKFKGTKRMEVLSS